MGEPAHVWGSFLRSKSEAAAKSEDEKRSPGENKSRFPGFRGAVPRPDGVSGDPTGVAKPDLTAVRRFSCDGACRAAATGFPSTALRAGGMTGVATDRIILSVGNWSGVTGVEGKVPRSTRRNMEHPKPPPSRQPCFRRCCASRGRRRGLSLVNGAAVRPLIGRGKVKTRTLYKNGKGCGTLDGWRRRTNITADDRRLRRPPEEMIDSIFAICEDGLCSFSV
jgi:hypothetical protein